MSQKSDWVLAHFLPKYISRGVAIDRPIKTPAIIAGTRSSPARIALWQEKARTGQPLSSRAEKTLEKFYARFQYQQLRASGASTSIASRFKNRPPDQIKHIVNSYDTYTRQVHKRRVAQQRRKGRDIPSLEMIIDGFSQSDIEYEDWEAYISSSGTKKNPKTYSDYKDQTL